MNIDTVINPKIIIKDLNFYYGNFRALKDINLSIAEKMVTAFSSIQNKKPPEKSCWMARISLIRNKT
jgi:hypothetical protein